MSQQGPQDHFDTDAFMDSVQTAAVETKFVPVPENEYPATVKQGSVKVEPVNFKDGRTGKRFTAYWDITDANALRELGMEVAGVRQQFLLDLNDDGSIAAGVNKNLRLGKILAAGGIDQSKGWSFRQIEGVSAKVRVKHRPDQNDPEIVYAEVVAVTKL